MQRRKKTLSVNKIEKKNLQKTILVSRTEKNFDSNNKESNNTLVYKTYKNYEI